MPLVTVKTLLTRARSSPQVSVRVCYVRAPLAISLSHSKPQCSIGDWYPERNVFQILIALTSGARFVLVWLQYQMQSAQGPDAYLPGFVFWVGILRTFR
jgi:hypothetical protein